MITLTMQEESKSGRGRGDEQPTWSQNFLSEGHGDSQSGSQLQRKSQQEANAALNLEFAEPELQMFDYISQVQLSYNRWVTYGRSEGLKVDSCTCA